MKKKIHWPKIVGFTVIGFAAITILFEILALSGNGWLIVSVSSGGHNSDNIPGTTSSQTGNIQLTTTPRPKSRLGIDKNNPAASSADNDTQQSQPDDNARIGSNWFLNHINNGGNSGSSDGSTTSATSGGDGVRPLSGHRPVNPNRPFAVHRPFPGNIGAGQSSFVTMSTSSFATWSKPWHSSSSYETPWWLWNWTFPFSPTSLSPPWTRSTSGTGGPLVDPITTMTPNDNQTTFTKKTTTEINNIATTPTPFQTPQSASPNYTTHTDKPFYEVDDNSQGTSNLPLLNVTDESATGNVSLTHTQTSTFTFKPNGSGSTTQTQHNENVNVSRSTTQTPGESENNNTATEPITSTPDSTKPTAILPHNTGHTSSDGNVEVTSNSTATAAEPSTSTPDVSETTTNKNASTTTQHKTATVAIATASTKSALLTNSPLATQSSDADHGNVSDTNPLTSTTSFRPGQATLVLVPGSSINAQDTSTATIALVGSTGTTTPNTVHSVTNEQYTNTDISSNSTVTEITMASSQGDAFSHSSSPQRPRNATTTSKGSSVNPVGSSEISSFTLIVGWTTQSTLNTNTTRTDNLSTGAEKLSATSGEMTVSRGRPVALTLPYMSSTSVDTSTDVVPTAKNPDPPNRFKTVKPAPVVGSTESHNSSPIVSTSTAPTLPVKTTTERLLRNLRLFESTSQNSMSTGESTTDAATNNAEMLNNAKPLNPNTVIAAISPIERSGSQTADNHDGSALRVRRQLSSSSSSASSRGSGKDDMDALGNSYWTMHMGIWNIRLCGLSTEKSACFTVSSKIGFQMLSAKSLNTLSEDTGGMATWNDLRVETMFALLSAVVGLVCAVLSVRPFCLRTTRRATAIVGAIAFLLSGVLFIVAMAKISSVSKDMKDTFVRIDRAFVVNTPWAVVISGIGVGLALVSAVMLLLYRWAEERGIWQKFADDNTAVAYNVNDQPESGNYRPATVAADNRAFSSALYETQPGTGNAECNEHYYDTIENGKIQAPHTSDGSAGVPYHA